MSHHVGMHKCSNPECKNEFRAHEWGTKRAQREGWFLQKNNDKWCPDHLPEWVAEWRAKNGFKNGN